MTTLPRDRELDPAAHTGIRAEVVAAATPARPDRRWRWTPAVAAAGLAAVVLGIVGVASSAGPRPTTVAGTAPSPQPSLPPPGPTDPASLLQRCIAGSLVVGPSAVRPTSGSVRVLFEDRYGYLLQVVGPTYSMLCGFDREGRNIGPGSPGAPSAGSGYLPDDSTEAVSTQEWGNYSGGVVKYYLPSQSPGVPIPGTATRIPLDPGPETRYAIGVIRRDVAELEVTWAGAAPVRAAINGPFWLARAALPPGHHATETPADVVAYDRAGNVVGRTHIVG